MKLKNILIQILLVIVVSQSLYGNKNYFTIQLATVSKTDKALNYLQTEATRLNSKLLRETRIVFDGKYYILYALITTSEHKVTKILPEYKKIFNGAYIRKHDPTKVELVKSYKSTNNKPKQIQTEPAKPVPIQSKPTLQFTNNMLVNRTVYALYTKDTKDDNIALVALELLNDFTMNFKVLLGKKHEGEGNYFIDFQGRFYLYSDENNRYKDYYTLIEKKKNYMKVNAWENGVKNDNEIRFYYSLSHAKKYIDLLLAKK